MSEPFPEEVLAPLRQRFLVRANAALDLVEAWRAGADVAAELQQAAHKMAGIAATLGYGEIGQAAAKVELRDLSQSPDADALTEITGLHAALVAATGRDANP